MTAWTSEPPTPGEWYWFEGNDGQFYFVDCRRDLPKGARRSTHQIPRAEVLAAMVQVCALAPKLVKGIDDWNAAVQGIVGRRPEHTWGDLEGMRAALRALEEARRG